MYIFPNLHSEIRSIYWIMFILMISGGIILNFHFNKFFYKRYDGLFLISAKRHENIKSIVIFFIFFHLIVCKLTLKFTCKTPWLHDNFKHLQNVTSLFLDISCNIFLDLHSISFPSIYNIMGFFEKKYLLLWKPFLVCKIHKTGVFWMGPRLKSILVT